MNSFSKDKKTGLWYCSDCKKPISKKLVFSNYDYFNSKKNKEHNCEVD